jgi:two-component system, LuxR family, sensor kinase FixL
MSGTEKDNAGSFGRVALQVLLTGVVYYLTTRIAWALCFPNSKVSLLFPPHAVLVVILLLVPGRHWWAYTLATIVAHFVATQQAHWPVLYALHCEAFDAVQHLLAAAGIRFFVKSPLKSVTLRDALVFVLVAVIIVPFGTAFWGAAFTVSNNFGTRYWVEWRNLGVSNGVTAVVLVPAFLLLAGRLARRAGKLSPARLLEGSLLALGIITSGWFVFAHVPAGPETSPALLYAPIPLLIWAALRFGLSGISAAMLVVTFQAIWGAMHGRGPFLEQSPAENALALQMFLIVTGTPLMFLTVVLEDDKRSQQALHESEERVALAAEAAHLGVWELDLTTRELWVSGGWRSIFQFGPDEPIGYEDFRTRIHSEDRAGRDELIERAINEKSGYQTEYGEIEYRIVLPDDTVRWIAGRVRCVPNALGLPPRLVGVAADITERRQAEDDARRHRDQINLLSRVSLLGEMTASLAHELGQPLAAIVTNASAGMRLIDGDKDDSATLRDVLADVAADGRRAHEIIQNVRNTVKKGDVIRHPIDLNELVTKVARVVRLDAVAYSCEIETSLARDLPFIDGDPVQIQQVLVNLVGNAFDAMQETAVHRRKVEISTTGNGDGAVCLSVRDHGTGLLGKARERLFDQFFTTKEHGLGMGLAIVRSIVESHGGEIQAENMADGGARFYFTLPTTTKT